jgi:hypothetical protein
MIPVVFLAWDTEIQDCIIMTLRIHQLFDTQSLVLGIVNYVENNSNTKAPSNPTT